MLVCLFKISFSSESRPLNSTPGSPSAYKSNSTSNTSNSFNNLNMPPILVVGTKLDHAQKVRNSRY